MKTATPKDRTKHECCCVYDSSEGRYIQVCPRHRARGSLLDIESRDDSHLDSLKWQMQQKPNYRSAR